MIMTRGEGDAFGLQSVHMRLTACRQDQSHGSCTVDFFSIVIHFILSVFTKMDATALGLCMCDKLGSRRWDRPVFCD